MKDVLITGGCGFIGSNLACLLAKQGVNVRILDLNPNFPVWEEPDGKTSWLSLITHYTGDIRERELCRRAMRGTEAVIHLAAQAGIAQSLENPIENASVNFGGTLNLLVAAKETGVGRFIFSSSGAVLGEHNPPGHEEMPAKPISPYGAGKLAAEAYCQGFTGAYGLSTAILRFSNVYGPGSFHKGSVVASFCKQALQQRPLVIYGDGTQTRDFLYVLDLAEWIRYFLEKPKATGVFHLSSGRPTTIASLCLLIQRLASQETGQRPPVRKEPARSFEVRESYFSNRKAGMATGYTPKTAVEQGVTETWRWFVRNSKQISLLQV